jgi:hypothetical protein
VDYLKWCNAVNPKSRAGFKSQDEYEISEQKRIKFVRDSSFGTRLRVFGICERES